MFSVKLIKKTVFSTIILCGILSSFIFNFNHKSYAATFENKTIASHNKPINENALLSALALNYCRQSIAKVLNYNDKMVLDEEYNTIINKIDLSKIQDLEVISLITELMDFMVEYKIREENKKRIIKKYENKSQNKSFRESKWGFSN